MPRDSSWRLQAKCLVDPRAQVIDFTHPRSEQEILDAIAFCKDACPVRQECMNWAIEFQESGVWGGTTEAERLKLDDLYACPTCGETGLLTITSAIHVCTSCGLVA